MSVNQTDSISQTLCTLRTFIVCPERTAEDLPARNVPLLYLVASELVSSDLVTLSVVVECVAAAGKELVDDLLDLFE